MFLTAAVIVAFVAALFVLSARRRDVADTAAIDRRFLVWGGVALPAVVLSVLLGLNVVTLLEQPDGGELRVEIVGRQYWWEVRYPDGEVVTANELHIPTGTDVQFVLNSADVNHSFWVPQLSGKRDLIPGRTTSLTIRADQPGRYEGQCAEFCGIQHANMRFLVIADEPRVFERWLSAEAQPAVAARTAAQQRGEETFMNSSCAGCHTIRGTPATGRVGPDLTHFAARTWVGAGAAPNDRGHLGSWVANAQVLKEGNHMPPVEIEAARLPDLLTYLEALQ